MSRDDRSRGFTLPELFVAIIGAVILLVASALLLRPQTYAAQRHDAQRWVSLALLVDGLRAYQQANGRLPSSLPAQAQRIGSLSGEFDLCKYLVPDYLPNIPFDPTSGTEIINDPSVKTATCATSGVTYSTGLSISLSKTNVLRVTADGAEGGMPISLTQQF